MKVLVIGISGMVGHKLFAELSKRPSLDVYGTARNTVGLERVFGHSLMQKVMDRVDVNSLVSVEACLQKLRPQAVILCVGITKQLVDDSKPAAAIAVNALMPHYLAEICAKYDARLVQMATDCVFSGAKGNYLETDPSDATDVYGRTKFLGEVYYPHCLTVRTSFIGHELGKAHGLVAWFLSQQGEAEGFTRAIYSGMPTVEIARLMAEYILPNARLSGLYQVSSDPISKFDLLGLVARQYGKQIEIRRNDVVKIDRSLNSDRFRSETGFRPTPWEKLIRLMYEDYNACNYYPLIERKPCH